MFYAETNNAHFPTSSQTTKQAIFVGRFSKCSDRYKYNTYCRLFITDRKMFLAKPKIGQANLESLTLTDFYRIADFSLSLLLKNRRTFHCWCRLYYSKINTVSCHLFSIIFAIPAFANPEPNAYRDA